MSNSAPHMGGTASANVAISSWSGVGTTKAAGSVGSSAPQTLATKHRPMSRQYASVECRSVFSSLAPKCSTPCPRPAANASHMRRCTGGDTSGPSSGEPGCTSMRPLGSNPQISVPLASGAPGRERWAMLELGLRALRDLNAAGHACAGAAGARLWPAWYAQPPALRRSEKPPVARVRLHGRLRSASTVALLRRPTAGVMGPGTGRRPIWPTFVSSWTSVSNCPMDRTSA